MANSPALTALLYSLSSDLLAMPFSSLHSLTPILLAAVTGAPALALPADKVASTLDSIIVFSPITTQVSGEIQPLNYELDGESRSVYFAAFSPSAVQKIIKEKITPQNPELAKSLKFAPFSLSKFDSTVQPSLQLNKDSRVIYVPDPDQVSITEELLIRQGAKKADAAMVAKTSPAVFCPQPAIKATPGSGPLKGQSFVPCSTDYKTVQEMVDKGVSTNAALKKTKPVVVAIPMRNFAAMLAKGDTKDVGEIRVLPTPSTLKALQQLRSAASKSTSD